MLENSDTSAKLMSLPQIAKYLGVAERTVYLWAQQGKIPAFKLGSAWRFKREEIDNWIETTRTGPKNISNDELLTSPSKIPSTKKEMDEAEKVEYESSFDEESLIISEGSKVRVIREPFFGKIGMVSSLPKELIKMNTETMTRTAEIMFDDGKKEIVPRSNLEVILSD